MKLLSGLALAVALVAGGSVLAASYQDGLSAYTANRVDEAKRLYGAVAVDAAAPAKAQADAARELGRIAWLIDADLAAAEQHLRMADAAGHGSCRTGKLYVRVLREAGAYLRAVAKAREVLPRCDDPAEADEVRIEGALASLAAVATGPQVKPGDVDAARDLLGGISDHGRASLSANAAGLRLALLERDAGAALEAWRGYFWLPAGSDAPQAMAAWRGRVERVFSAGLDRRASPSVQADLAEMLARAGFHEDAASFALQTDLEARAAGDPSWRRVAAYLAYRRGLAAATDTLNRSLAKGGSRAPDDYQVEMQRLATEAATALSATGDAKLALFESFGLYGTVGLTGGYPSAHIGHVVRDERRSVEQYGRRGEVRFIVVDNMLANGFESWLWDGRAAAGGWAEDGSTIIQVRPGYTERPLKAWLMTHDTPARRRWERDLPGLEQRDRDVLRRHAIAYLPGVDARLARQAIEQIAARAALKGGDRRRAFLDEYERAVSQHSIFIHEGRHVLDQASGEQLTSEDLEYRAKLSELALADYPRLPLAGVDADTIGTDSPHGRANARILQAYGTWMLRNQSRIAGFDPTIPGLAQLDRLSDEQIREVARSLDPWVRP